MLPSAVILWALRYAYVTFGAWPVAAGVLAGLKLAVLAIVAAAAVRIGKRVIKNEVMAGIAILSLMLIVMINMTFPMLVLGAGLLGFLGSRQWPRKFIVLDGKTPNVSGDSSATNEESVHSERITSFWRALSDCEKSQRASLRSMILEA